MDISQIITLSEVGANLGNEDSSFIFKLAKAKMAIDKNELITTNLYAHPSQRTLITKSLSEQAEGYFDKKKNTIFGIEIHYSEKIPENKIILSAEKIEVTLQADPEISIATFEV